VKRRAGGGNVACGEERLLERVDAPRRARPRSARSGTPISWISAGTSIVDPLVLRHVDLVERDDDRDAELAHLAREEEVALEMARRRRRRARRAAASAGLVAAEEHFEGDLFVGRAGRERVRCPGDRARRRGVRRAMRYAPSTRSTVTPAKLPTRWLRPVSALKRVVLPVFGLPMMATRSGSVAVRRSGLTVACSRQLRGATLRSDGDATSARSAPSARRVPLTSTRRQWRLPTTETCAPFVEAEGAEAAGLTFSPHIRSRPPSTRLHPSRSRRGGRCRPGVRGSWAWSSQWSSQCVTSVFSACDSVMRTVLNGCRCSVIRHLGAAQGKGDRIFRDYRRERGGGPVGPPPRALSSFPLQPISIS
jgi:hypothetical protein